jgi:hypothetical protein
MACRSATDYDHLSIAETTPFRETLSVFCQKCPGVRRAIPMLGCLPKSLPGRSKKALL